MSTPQSENALNGKGWCFAYFLVAMILFVLLVAYILNGNYNSLTPN
jgi:hypothetical protein